MLGKIRDQFEMKCPKCGATVVIKEIDDGSPARCYDSALCPKCSTKVYEKSIVGVFETELKVKE